MLHIIGLILKFIGILLLVILGILVLLVCAVLFTGLRYRFKASCDGKIDSLQADLSVSWFFRLVRAEVHVTGTTVSYAVKVAWKKFITSETEPGAKEPDGEDGGEQKNGPPSEKEDEASGLLTEDKAEMPGVSAEDKIEIPDVSAEDKAEISGVSAEDKAEKSGRPAEERLGETPELTEKTADSTEPSVSQRDREAVKHTEQRQDDRKGQGFLRRTAEKIRAWYEKIKYTFQKICDNIKLLLQKKETLTEFIEDPLHRTAFAKVLEEMLRFLKRFKPDKLSAELVFGFEDPYLTGKALAFFGMMYPFWGESVSVIPDFEHRMLKGKVFLKGHFRASYAAAAGIRLLLHKPTRTTIGHIRNFKW